MLERGLGKARWGVVFASGVAATSLAFAGCSASSPGGGASDSDSGSGANDSDSGLQVDGDGSLGGNSGGKYCDQVDLNFNPKTPTVYILVDRSGSIFGANLWVPLRDALLPVIDQLQAKVRFGFGTYTGTAPDSCGLSDLGTIALNNYDAIASAYNALGQPSGKAETPSTQALGEVRALLDADTEAPGDKFILFVTGDDDQDFCNDPGTDCAADAIVATLQQAVAGSKIQTFVFGVDTGKIAHPEWFDYWAQAGIGEDPNWTEGLTVDQYSGQLNSQCNGYALWAQRKTENGNSGFLPAGKYSAAGGTAKAILESDPATIASEIETRVKSIKSCVLDLTSQGVSFKTGAHGEVLIEGQTVPAEQWRIDSPTVLELLGDACVTWKKPESVNLKANFTCDQLNVVK